MINPYGSVLFKFFYNPRQSEQGVNGPLGTSPEMTSRSELQTEARNFRLNRLSPRLFQTAAAVIEASAALGFAAKSGPEENNEARLDECQEGRRLCQPE